MEEKWAIERHTEKKDKIKTSTLGSVAVAVFG